MPILTEDERIGTVLGGKYRVRCVLARGGMGVLFVGDHTWTGRPVAIKLLAPDHTTDGTAATRFLREGRAATTLRHPHVVEVLDMGEAEDGALFMALELLEGADLAAVRRIAAPLTPAHAIELLTPIIDALALAHERGFVHRDLKPSNVFLARQGDGRFVPTLLDFGIAKALSDDDASATRSGMIVGTPHYMSPEQATGEGEVGPATDVWALGVVLYELIAGTLPYDGGSPTAILMSVLQTTHAPLGGVASSTPSALVDLIERALRKDPSERPRDLRAWAGELRAAAGLPPTSLPLHAALPIASEPTARAIAAATDTRGATDPPPPPDGARARSQPRASAGGGAKKRTWWAVAGAGALMLVLIVAALAFHTTAPEPVARPLAPTPSAAPAGMPTQDVQLAAPVEPAKVAVDPVRSEPSPSTTPVRTAPTTRSRPERVPATDPRARGRRPVAEITTEW